MYEKIKELAVRNRTATTQEQRTAIRAEMLKLQHTKVLSMSYIAQKYFGKTRSWLSHKLNGDVVNGKTVSFTEER